MPFSLRTLVGLSAALIGAPVAAHDFWIQPAAFQTRLRAPAPLTLQVGHGADRQRSRLPLRRVVRFATVGPDGRVVEMMSALSLGGPDHDGAVTFETPGLHQLILETDYGAQSHLPADRFNAYAADEGLVPALDERRRRGREGAPASERYSRNAKALVQVGPATADIRLAGPVGLPLEIVTEANPYATPRPAALPVRVFYRGGPLAGALVKLTDLDNDAAPLETQRTDSEGRARFAMPSAGRWRFNVVWTRPLPKREPVEFETVFSSLSFGVPPS